MFAATARASYRFRWIIIIAAAVAFPIALIIGRDVFSSLDPGGYDDPGTESIKARELNIEEFGLGRADFVVLYTAPEGSTVDDPAVAGPIRAALERGGADPVVERLLSFFNTGAAPLVSNDRTRTFAVMSLEGDIKEKLETFEHLEELFHAEGPVTTQYGGVIPVFHENQLITERDLRRAEMIAFPITAILLMLIFRSVVAAMVPLILGGLAIVFALAVIYGLASITRVNIFALNVVTILGLGLAIDYSLFILTRYREEVPELGVEGAIIRSVSTTGKAVAFSGVTLTASMVALFFFPQVYLRSLAMGGIAVTILAILIATTVLPALLGVLGPNIERFRLPFLRGGTEEPGPAESGFWHTLAFAVMRRPVIIGVAVVAVLLLLGAPFLRFNGSTQDARAIGKGIEARDVFDILNSEFTPHETTPHQVVIDLGKPATSAESIGELFDYFGRLSAIADIQRIDSVFGLAPGLTKEQYQAIGAAPPESLDPQTRQGLELFLNGNFARFSLISKAELDSSIGQHQVEQLRALEPPSGARVLVGGDAAELFDVKQSLRDRLPMTLAFIAVATFVVLFLVFGSITLPFKAMAMNLLSLTSSFGATVFIFQDGRFQSLLHYESLGAIDVTLPLVMFAIVFGLSMDYEVLMLSRVREEYERTGDNTLAVARGLEKTGRLITSAAAILIVVIAAFATSSLVIMKSLGVGMALAILIDATIVRALLVPATMRLMGHWNWWAPGPLHRLWERMGLGDLEGHGSPAPHPAPVLAPAYAGPGGLTAIAPSYRPEAPSPATALTAVAPALIQQAPPRLSIKDGATFDLTAVTTGGRDPSNTIALTDPLASSRHFSVGLEADGGAFIEDLGSTNGTRVDGERITGRTRLSDGAEILVGTTILTYSAPMAMATAAKAVPGRPISTAPPTVVTKKLPGRVDSFLMIEGDEPGRIFHADGDTYSIGRDDRNKIVLTDVKVSGFHTRIQRGLDGGLVVEDWGSTNGTYLNDTLLEDAMRLEDGDVLRLGDTALQFQRDPV